MKQYLLVFGDSQNDYEPFIYEGTLIGAERRAKKHANELDTGWDVKRRYEGRWERIGDVGDYDEGDYGEGDYDEGDGE